MRDSARIQEGTLNSFLVLTETPDVIRTGVKRINGSDIYINLFDFIQEEVRFNTSGSSLQSSELLSARNILTGIMVGTVTDPTEHDFESLYKVANFFVYKIFLINLFLRTAYSYDVEVIPTIPHSVRDFLLQCEGLETAFVDDREYKKLTIDKLFGTSEQQEFATEFELDKRLTTLFIGIIDSIFPVRYLLNYREIYCDFCSNGPTKRYLTKMYYASQGVALFEA